MTLPDRDDVSRRQFLQAAVAVGGATGLSACLGDSDSGDGTEHVDAPTGGNLDARPSRQYGWNEALERDEDGNVRSPSHHVLTDLSLIADGTPSDSHRETVEDAFRELERALAWQPEGLVFTAGYTPAYFDRFDEPLPESVDLPEPGTVTYLEDPELIDFDSHDLTVHLASDDPAVVLAAEEALLGNRETLNGHEVATSLDGVLERSGGADGRRTGFVGPGLPAEKQESGDAEDMPEHDIHEEAPFWMGYRSGFQESQATEDYVAVQDGPFVGGTTQHVETLQLNIDTWFDQDSHHERVSKLFSHVHADEGRVGEFGEKLGTSTGVMEVVDETADDARNQGVVGHAQKTAQARENGTPPLLRRDFNTTVAGNLPGVHFLSLQKGISTFERVRRAMAGEELAEDGAVSVRQNNGILQYLSVLRRGNYLLPPRNHRSLPSPNP